MTDTADLQAILDRQAITDLIYRYCRAVDRLDVPLGHSIWNQNSFADYGAEFYQGDGPGVIDKICREHGYLLHHAHQVTNILIALDGDKAGSESYCIATLQLGEPENIKQFMVWSRYIDSWSRPNGRWGLDKRIAIRDFDEVRNVTQLAQHHIGKRDSTDPSYKLLGF